MIEKTNLENEYKYQTTSKIKINNALKTEDGLKRQS